MPRQRFPLLAVFIPVVLIAIACSVDPTDQETTPVAPSFTVDDAVTLPGAFYPLSVGNRWTYRRVMSLSVVPDEGTPPPPEVTVDTMTRRQVWIQSLADREYVREEDYIGPYLWSVRWYRQDRHGLYEGGIPTRVSGKLTAGSRPLGSAVSMRVGADPTCLGALLRKHAEVMQLAFGTPPGNGSDSGEIQRLAYPLHEGVTWVVNDFPLVVATVEGLDRIAGSPAYRIRIDNELTGPDDQVYYWFGRCGFVAMHTRLEAVATDENGSRIGVAVSEETWDLESVDIDHGGCEVGSDNGVIGGDINTYPLAVGNHWTYRIERRYPLSWYVTVFIVDEEQVATADIDGRTYIKEVLTYRAPAELTSVSYLRQDHEGLYRLDPPQLAAGSPQKGAHALARAVVSGDLGEQTELAYPLKVGRTWTIRDDATHGLWTATVEARERVSLPIGEYNAFRVRINRETDPVGSELLVWYGSVGVLRVLSQSQTIEGIATEEWTLQEVDLKR